MPFLTVGGTLGWREEVSGGVSELSGEYCVENVKGEDGELYRRLIFLSNANIIQSECHLISSNQGPFFLLFFSALFCGLVCGLEVEPVEHSDRMVPESTRNWFSSISTFILMKECKSCGTLATIPKLLRKLTERSSVQDFEVLKKGQRHQVVTFHL